MVAYSSIYLKTMALEYTNIVDDYLWWNNFSMVDSRCALCGQNEMSVLTQKNTIHKLSNLVCEYT